jgi:cation:H+ antiporter
LFETIELVAGFFLLIKGAGLLVEGATAIARRLRVSDLAVGLTVVAFGTSTPELFVNVTAGMQGNTDLAIGNILGSNIANILLILGTAALICPIPVTGATAWKEIPFGLLAVIVLGLLANDRLIDGAAASIVSRGDGLVLLGFFAIFLYHSVAVAGDLSGLSDRPAARVRSTLAAALWIVAGLTGLALGGRWIVESATVIAGRIGVSQEVIGLSVVAVGTSLPELATSTVAALKGKVEIAVGNVVGSNIFNVFFVVAVSSIVTPLPFRGESNFDLVAAILSSLLLFGFMFSGGNRKIDRWEGAAALVLYAAYLTYRFLGQ